MARSIWLKIDTHEHCADAETYQRQVHDLWDRLYSLIEDTTQPFYKATGEVECIECQASFEHREPEGQGCIAFELLVILKRKAQADISKPLLRCRICRCKLVRSTVSPSARMMVPIPAAAR